MELTREQRQAIGLANSVIMVADKFIGKVESGKARSVETFSDMKKLKAEALLLKETLEPKKEPYQVGRSFTPHAFDMQRDVDFFLRIHRHLPDQFCGDKFPFGKCNYRPDEEPINAMNERVDELKKDPLFLEKEREVEEAVKQKWQEMGW